MTIKAIETHYNGYRFRSRLEARWAVFLDALPKTDWEWRYETEGYDMHGLRYLPDFELIGNPGRNGYGEMVQNSALIEVKGKILSPDEWNKSIMFTAYLKHDIYIFQGDVGLSANISWISSLPNDMPEYLLDTKAIPPFMCSEQMYWTQCNVCGICDIDLLSYDGVFGPCVHCQEGTPEEETDDLLRADDAAHSARFEHGETPKVQRGKPRK